MKVKYVRSIFYYITILLITYFGYLAYLANSDLVSGRYVLFMDEQITFDGVHNILHPKSFDHWLYSIADGGDHRYGRLLWVSMALTSWLPESAWGDSAQILTGRMTQTFVLFLAFSVLTLTFLKNNLLRILLLFTLMVMPYTEYYLSMPKPEPLQLLLLSLFFLCYTQRSYTFGICWFLLGAAFGMKISILPIMFITFILSCAVYIQNGTQKVLLSEFKIALMSGILGFALVVPIFLVPAGLLLLGLASNFVIKPSLTRVFGQSILTDSISNTFIIIPLFLGYNHIQDAILRWSKFTIFNRSHPVDNSNVDFLAWSDFWLNSWMNTPSYLSLLLLFFLLILLAISLNKMVCDLKFNFARMPAGLLLLVCGLSVNLIIFVSAHRLWGMYLFIGSVLILVGVVALINVFFDHYPEQALLYRFGTAVCALLCYISVMYWYPLHKENIERLSNRTQSPEYIKNLSIYNALQTFVKTHGISADKNPIKIGIDPMLFQPPSDKKYRFIRFWGRYTQWDGSFDILVFGDRFAEATTVAPQSGSAINEKYIEERKKYKTHVIEAGTSCESELCYERVFIFDDQGGEILFKKSS